MAPLHTAMLARCSACKPTDQESTPSAPACPEVALSRRTPPRHGAIDAARHGMFPSEVAPNSRVAKPIDAASAAPICVDNIAGISWTPFTNDDAPEKSIVTTYRCAQRALHNSSATRRCHNDVEPSAVTRCDVDAFIQRRKRSAPVRTATPPSMPKAATTRKAGSVLIASRIGFPALLHCKGVLAIHAMTIGRRRNPMYVVYAGVELGQRQRHVLWVFGIDGRRLRAQHRPAAI